MTENKDNKQGKDVETLFGNLGMKPERYSNSTRELRDEQAEQAAEARWPLLGELREAYTLQTSSRQSQAGQEQASPEAVNRDTEAAVDAQTETESAAVEATPASPASTRKPRKPKTTKAGKTTRKKSSAAAGKATGTAKQSPAAKSAKPAATAKPGKKTAAATRSDQTDKTGTADTAGKSGESKKPAEKAREAGQTPKTSVAKTTGKPRSSASGKSEQGRQTPKPPATPAVDPGQPVANETPVAARPATEGDKHSTTTLAQVFGLDEVPAPKKESRAGSPEPEAVDPVPARDAPAGGEEVHSRENLENLFARLRRNEATPPEPPPEPKKPAKGLAGIFDKLRRK